MHTAEVENDSVYKSGFLKNVSRTKYDLPLNERLKIARNAKGLSTARVVAALKKKGIIDIGHSTLQGYEAKEASLNHRYPTIPTLIALSDFYGCSMDFLFGLTDKIERPKARKKRVQKPQPIDLKEKLLAKGEQAKSEPVYYGDKKLLVRQKKLISAQIELMLSQTI